MSTDAKNDPGNAEREKAADQYPDHKSAFFVLATWVSLGAQPAAAAGEGHVVQFAPPKLVWFATTEVEGSARHITGVAVVPIRVPTPITTSTKSSIHFIGKIPKKAPPFGGS